jgi:hypothetical protein
MEVEADIVHLASTMVEKQNSATCQRLIGEEYIGPINRKSKMEE